MATAGIRLAEERDAAAIAAIYAPNITNGVASFELIAPGPAEMAQRMAAVNATHPWLVCEVDGQVAGYVYASQHMARAAYQWSANVSAYVDAGYHRRGIGRALYSSLFALLRLQGFYNAYAGITLPNAGSVGLHEGMGFQLVGVYRDIGYKMRRWHDVGWWSLDLQAKLAAPSDAPLDLAAARKLPEWQPALEAGLDLLNFSPK